jgi:hypothetical protein
MKMRSRTVQGYKTEAGMLARLMAAGSGMSRDLVQVVGEWHLFFALNFTSQFLGETHLDIWMGTLNIRS